MIGYIYKVVLGAKGGYDLGYIRYSDTLKSDNSACPRKVQTRSSDSDGRSDVTDRFRFP